VCCLIYIPVMNVAPCVSKYCLMSVRVHLTPAAAMHCAMRDSVTGSKHSRASCTGLSATMAARKRVLSSGASEPV
jgi:hypothetical protein